LLGLIASSFSNSRLIYFLTLLPSTHQIASKAIGPKNNPSKIIERITIFIYCDTTCEGYSWKPKKPILEKIQRLDIPNNIPYKESLFPLI